MKIKELFTVGGMIQSIGDLVMLLDQDNCQIENKKKNDDAVILFLKRESDGNEGRVYLRVRKNLSEITDQLLNWAFSDKKMIGLTLNQLAEMDTDIQISKIKERVCSISRNF